MTVRKKTQQSENSMYLCAPVNALVEGIFEENIHIGEVLDHGDFGLGTFDDLDGEMLALDGNCYQINSDGSILRVDNHVLTPFACVTFYKPDHHYALEGKTPHMDFLNWLYKLLPSPNLFYAIRIEGEFAHIKARSVPKQANYHPLSDIAHDQVIFEFNTIRGTLAGFFTPDFMSSLSVPGLHLHFISADFMHGGHVLECIPQKVTAGIQMISKLELSLPMSRDYMNCNFNHDTKTELGKIE